MSKVYYLKNFAAWGEATKKLLADFYQPAADLVVKIHFGEPGNTAAFRAADVAPVITALKSLDLKPVLLDTPVAYHSPRHTAAGYHQVARDKGFADLAPVVISENYLPVKTKNFTAEVSRELVEAKNVLVLSHVKGHACAGFGGAIKNLGMGGLSQKTKQDIHALCKPQWQSECQGCGTCARLCPAQAITMVDNRAQFDLAKCWGCSICELSCPYHCLAPVAATFDDLLAQGAAAAINNFPPRTFYINWLKNIVEQCDCEREAGQTLAADLGVLFSDNPVAIDQASLDLINKASGREVFKEKSHKDPYLQVKFAAEHTKFAADYELIEIA